MQELASINPSTNGLQAVDALPHSTEAEQQLLGAILTNNDVYDKVSS
ncbi:MAG: DnaB-like helicase N-terminal domain-containing protein, partial [Pseudomonadota bacterium]